MSRLFSTKTNIFEVPEPQRECTDDRDHIDKK